MKPSLAILAALLLAPCACARHEQAPPSPTVYAEPIDPGPAAQPAPAPSPAPTVAEPEPQPTPEEVAAFQAPVPK